MDDEENDGHANFPEYQNVYIEPCAYEALQEDKRVSRWHDLLQGVPADFAWAEPGWLAHRAVGQGDFPGAAAASHEGCSGRYGGCGVMIYWHVERGSVCIHSTESLGSRVGSAPNHRLKSTKAFETSYSS